MEENKTYYVGTDIKAALNVTGVGFSQADDDYEVELVCGGRSVTVPKSKIVVGEGGIFLLTIDTTRFPNGLLCANITAKVPDDDFESGFRREVTVLKICTLKYKYKK